MTQFDEQITREEANDILDGVAAGANVSPELVTHCLRITGDLKQSRLVWSSDFFRPCH